MSLYKKEFRLKEKDFLFINNVIKLEYKEIIFNSYIILLSENEIKKVLDKLSSYLIQIGLDNDKPNRTGCYIESLIDYFSSKLYE